MSEPIIRKRKTEFGWESWAEYPQTDDRQMDFWPADPEQAEKLAESWNPRGRYNGD